MSKRKKAVNITGRITKNGAWDLVRQPTWKFGYEKSSLPRLNGRKITVRKLWVGPFSLCVLRGTKKRWW